MRAIHIGARGQGMPPLWGIIHLLGRPGDPEYAVGTAYLWFRGAIRRYWVFTSILFLLELSSLGSVILRTPFLKVASTFSVFTSAGS